MFRKKQKLPPDLGRHRLRVEQPASRGAVFSYHANRSARPGNVGRDSEELEKPVKRAKHKRWWRKASNLMLVALAFALLLVSLQLNSRPRVVIVGDASGRIFLRPTDAYTKAAHDLFAGSFMNGNKVTVDAGGIATRLRTQFPELTAVSVSLPTFGHQPVVYIQPAIPRLVLTSKDGSAYVIDHAGRALLDAKQISDPHALEQVPTITDQSGLRITAGHVVLDSGSVSFVTEVIGQLKAQHMAIESMALPAAGSELDVKVQGIPYIVKYNLRGSAREEAGTFLAVKQQLERDHKQPKQYIDVRVAGRAYYK